MDVLYAAINNEVSIQQVDFVSFVIDWLQLEYLLIMAHSGFKKREEEKIQNDKEEGRTPLLQVLMGVNVLNM